MELPRYGDDGGFGDETAAALRLFFKKVSPTSSYTGREIVGYVAFYLMDRAFG